MVGDLGNRLLYLHSGPLVEGRSLLRPIAHYFPSKARQKQAFTLRTEIFVQSDTAGRSRPAVSYQDYSLRSANCRDPCNVVQPDEEYRRAF